MDAVVTPWADTAREVAITSNRVAKMFVKILMKEKFG
jgi:hypothetical protein